MTILEWTRVAPPGREWTAAVALFCLAVAATACWDPVAPSKVEDVDPKRMLNDVRLLASPAMGGRAAGTAGNEEALSYVEAVFARLRLAPRGTNGSYRQTFGVVAPLLLARPVLSLGAREAVLGTDYTVLAYSGSRHVRAKVVFVGYGISTPPFDPVEYPECPLPPSGYDDYAGLDVRDRIVIALSHAPGEDLRIARYCPVLPRTCVVETCHWDHGAKARNASVHGAAALLLVPDYAHGPEIHFDQRSTQSVHESHPRLPVVLLERRAAEDALPRLHAWATSIDGKGVPRSREPPWKPRSTSRRRWRTARRPTSSPRSRDTMRPWPKASWWSGPTSTTLEPSPSRAWSFPGLTTTPRESRS